MMVKINQVGQLGIVVHDVEKTAAYLEKQFQIGPFGIIPLNNVKAVYQGREIEYHLKVGLYELDKVLLELIEHTGGDDCILNDPAHLGPGGQGLHHVGFFVQDLDAAVGEWESRGGKLLQRGSFMPGGPA